MRFSGHASQGAACASRARKLLDVLELEAVAARPQFDHEAEPTPEWMDPSRDGGHDMSIEGIGESSCFSRRNISCRWIGDGVSSAQIVGPIAGSEKLEEGGGIVLKGEHVSGGSQSLEALTG